MRELTRQANGNDSDIMEFAELVNAIIYADETCSAVVSDFEALPAVDIGPSVSQFKRMAAQLDYAPVAHGRWEFKNDGRYGQRRCYCSICGKHSGIGGIKSNQLKLYCPNCGARMDGGDNDAESVD